MIDLKNEKSINEALLADDAKRKIIPVEDSRWGELIIPAKNENQDKTGKGFRVLAINSFLLDLFLTTLQTHTQKFQSKEEFGDCLTKKKR